MATSKGRFGAIKFNFMRATELFQDMNHEDMDVTAPPSGRDYFKEYEIAAKLNSFLDSLVVEGCFNDCAPRSPATNEEEAEDEEESCDSDSYGASTPESEGFDYIPDEAGDSDDCRSKESATDNEDAEEQECDC